MLVILGSILLSGISLHGAGYENSITVTCSVSGGCPATIGLVIFKLPGNRFRRCVGTIFERPDRVVSNAHCPPSSASLSEAYFITQGAFPEVIRLTQVTRTKYDLEAGAYKTDLMEFALASPVADLRPAQSGSLNSKGWKTFIINPVKGDSSNLRFQIEQRNCQATRHEMLFPYSLSESPSVVALEGCEIQAGNSGGPIFDSSERIVALANAFAANTETPFHLASNVSCLHLNCLRVTPELTKRRWISYQENWFAEILGREVPVRVGRVILPPARFELKSSEGREFELIYRPACLTQTQALNQAEFVSEHVRLTFDSYGRGKVERLNRRYVAVNVLQTLRRRGGGDDLYEAQMAWPLSEDSYLRESPQRLWGNQFTIDLTDCPR